MGGKTTNRSLTPPHPSKSPESRKKIKKHVFLCIPGHRYCTVTLGVLEFTVVMDHSKGLQPSPKTSKARRGGKALRQGIRMEAT